MKFRDYQQSIINVGTKRLSDYGLVYLSMEVRTGKTLTSLGIAQKIGASSVLFITKKKAIYSIENDYELLNPSFELEVINYESLHKRTMIKPDLVICDEAHSMGSFPKPSKRAKDVRNILVNMACPRLILMSGTPTPESFCQLYHQVYGHINNPFKRYGNFYKFAKDYVNVSQRRIGSNVVNDYSNGYQEMIMDAMKPYMISYTQKEAGFLSEIEEDVLYVNMKPKTYKLCEKLSKDLVIEGKEEVILADTSVKLMMKLHQMYSGTVKFESGNSMVLDDSKAEFIKWKFNGEKIAIFYKFKAELEALKETFGDDLTDNINEFDTTEKNIALQIVSGREGISLRKAKYIVYYNIDFSATSYWQSRDRMTTKNRRYNKVYWIFSKGGIEKKIYRAVNGKKNYTITHFKKDYGKRNN